MQGYGSIISRRVGQKLFTNLVERVAKATLFFMLKQDCEGLYLNYRVKELKINTVFGSFLIALH
jgi:hypothetical protein